jgi:endonuclease YncB( thermonuclease family)
MVAMLLPTFPVHAEQLAGLVVSIANGDTITLRDGNRQQHKIHLAGIAAPDVLQSFGQKSKAHLATLVFNREAVAECGMFDQSRRLICQVRINDVDVSLEQVKAGMAWHYTQYAKEQAPQDREDYEVAEFNAKLRRLGLWADKNPLPPWQWRKR